MLNQLPCMPSTARTAQTRFLFIVPMPSQGRAAGAIVVLSGLLGGCVIVPLPSVPQAQPFKDEQIAFVEVGKTTRQEVETKLGQPQVNRADGRLDVYGEARAVGSLVAGVYGGSGSISPIETFHYVMVRYDPDDVVTAFDVVRGKHGSTSDGICVAAAFETVEAHGLWYDVESVLKNRFTILLAPENDDRHAKRFSVEPDKCGIYLFETRSGMPGHSTLNVFRTGRPGTPIQSDGYLYWTQSPGTAILEAATLTEHVPSQTFEFECAAGNLYFVEINHHNQWIWKGTMTFSTHTIESGKEQVEDRQLILD